MQAPKVVTSVLAASTAGRMCSGTARAVQALAFLVLAHGLAACPDSSAERRIELTFAPNELPLEIDATCAAACAASATLRIGYPDDFYAEHEEIAFTAYRVDYDFGRDLDGIPFHAHPIDLSLLPGETKTLRVTFAGDRQRAFIAEHGAGLEDRLRGRAMLQLAGYDWNDEQVFVEIEANLVVD